MKTVWKFTLEVTDRQTIQMPISAKVLTAQFQGNQLCLWAEVEFNEGAEPETSGRMFEIFGTGHPMKPFKRHYIASVQQPGLPLVWHIYQTETV